jgi:GDP dissociation inhibitor
MKQTSVGCPGEQVLMCGGPLIGLMVQSGAHNSLEFKLVQSSYVWRAGGVPQAVPASRAAVFRERSLSPADKRCLMRFLTNANLAIQGQGPLQVPPFPLLPLSPRCVCMCCLGGGGGGWF